MTQAAIRRMIKDSVDAAIVVERARQANVRNDASGSKPVRGAVELRRWFQKTKSVFEISECAEGKKVKFAAGTLKGPTLTWWKTKVATMGLETVNQMPWTEMKQLMTAEFCPIEEVQRIEHEFWNLKVDAYIWGLTENIMGEVTSFKPADLNKAVRMAHKLMVQKSQARDARILEGKKRKMVEPERVKVDAYIWGLTENIMGEVASFKPADLNKAVKQEEFGEAHGRGYAIKDAEPQGPNVVTSMFLLNNCYAFVLFDSGSCNEYSENGQNQSQNEQNRAQNRKA
nr:hypothetical protein [Tanacetum cinerariifolium]